jgi:ankyrin repeat protein
LALLKLFVAKDKSIISIVNPNNESPLSMAVQQHKPTMVQQLIDSGADPTVVGDRGNGLFQMLLAQEPDRGIDRNKVLIPKILGILVKQKIDINKANESGDRPLHLAVKYHSVKIADLLLQHNADPNLTNQEGQTPLMAAIHGEKNEWIAKLLAAGVNVNAQDKEGLTPLHLLMQSLQRGRTDRDVYTEARERTKKLEIAQALFAHGANPNLTDRRGRSPLHVLAESELSLRANEQSCVRPATSLHPLFAPLLSQQADFKAVNSDGDSVLHIVAKYPKLVRQLVAMGADPLQRNRDGKNVLVVMTDGHDLTLDELKLLEIAVRGGDLNVRDAQGNTAIHRLLIDHVRDPLYDTKIEKLISNLLDLGASLDIINNKYQTPLDIARQNRASVKDSIEKHRAQHLQRQINQCKLEADKLKEGRS